MRSQWLAVFALAAAASLATSWTGRAAAEAPAATYLPSGQVAAAFAKGAPLVETDGYKVHASRREAPGMAEVHERDTDIIYVLEGGATIVTGGDVVEERRAAPPRMRSVGRRYAAGRPGGSGGATC